MTTKDEIFEYVMKSPENTNPAVLESLLNSIQEGGSNYSAGAIISINNTSTDEINMVFLGGTPINFINSNFIITASLNDNINYFNNLSVLPNYDNGHFFIDVQIGADADNYNVVFNGENIPFKTYPKQTSGYYQCTLESEIYPTEFNITISDK